MSLINEALKRAEQDKLRNIAPTNGLPNLPPVHETKRSRVSTPIAGMLIVAIMLVGSFAAWRLIGRGVNNSTPAQANAAIVPTAIIPPAAAPTPAMAVPTEPVTTAPLAPTKEYASVQPLPKTPTQEHPAVENGPKTIAGADTAVKEAADEPGTAVVPNTAAAPAVEPTATPPVKPQETPKVAAKPAAPEASKPEPKPEPQPEPKKPTPPRAIDYSIYKVTGIMQSADGGTAIINGLFVTPGQTVAEAKVVKIQENSVVLEIDGEKFTIRM